MRGSRQAHNGQPDRSGPARLAIIRQEALWARLVLQLCAEEVMLYYALVFLVVALIAGVLGVSGVASIASQIAWVLFVIAIVLFVVHLVTGRSRPVL
jgi:uncharacterized membrane protein YtjA (UPF0391 family)